MIRAKASDAGAPPRAPSNERRGRRRSDSGSLGISVRRRGAAAMRPLIPTYLSHSYRAQDRQTLQHFWELFWQAGFAFTVDPKSSDHLSIPYLELMMKRSACFVAIAPHREEQERYRTSPYIVFEHNMAVRAKKPLLVIAESQVAGHPFDDHRLSVFPPGDPARAARLAPLILQLRELSLPHAEGFDNVLGSVGLVLPSGRVHDRASAAIHHVLEAAGYRVEVLPHDPTRAPDFSAVDRHDFFVVDIGIRGMAEGLYYRFVPTIRFGYQPDLARRPRLPVMFTDEALERAGGSAQNVIWWSDERQLIEQLQPVVDKMQRPRRQFRSHGEGVGYFQSLGRSAQGPVFISNAHEQNDLARHLSRALDLNNISFFHYRYKNSIPMGMVWEEQLFEHLRASRLFVPLITEDYWKSDLCRREHKLAQQLARENGLQIYKYFLDETPDSASHTERLQGRILAGMSIEQQVRRIVDDIDDHLTMGEDKAS
jgi:hypothetical protein